MDNRDDLYIVVRNWQVVFLSTYNYAIKFFEEADKEDALIYLCKITEIGGNVHGKKHDNLEELDQFEF